MTKEPMTKEKRELPEIRVRPTGRRATIAHTKRRHAGLLSEPEPVSGSQVGSLHTSELYRVDRNDFRKNEKKSTIFTPAHVSGFLFSILNRYVRKAAGYVLDPCVGAGSLLKPWDKAGYRTI